MHGLLFELDTLSLTHYSPSMKMAAPRHRRSVLLALVWPMSQARPEEQGGRGQEEQGARRQEEQGARRQVSTQARLQVSSCSSLTPSSILYTDLEWRSLLHLDVETYLELA